MATDRLALRRQRFMQDAALAQMTHDFDLSAQDNHMKYERMRFTVVGEGTRSSQDRYRANYQEIDWRQ